MKYWLGLLASVLLLSCSGCASAASSQDAAVVAERFVRGIATADASAISETTGKTVSDADAKSLALELLGEDEAIAADAVEVGAPIHGGGDVNYMVRLVSGDLPNGDAYVDVTLSKDEGRWVVRVAGPVEVSEPVP